MDARERLRRYLEQRRELGESELVLDTMPVDDVMKMLGARQRSRASSLPDRSASPPAATALHADSRNAGAVDNTSVGHASTGQATPPATTPEPLAPPVPTMRNTDIPPITDWRVALGGASAASAARTDKETPSSESVRSPSSRASEAAQTTSTGPKTGEIPDWLHRLNVPIGMHSGRESLRGHATRLDLAIAELPTLEAIAQATTTCTRCSLHQTATRAVPGEGNPNADFVCVGEAPGQAEDAQGRPFVGPAGQLLTKILDAIRFSRSDVFICNVLKHRPPGNRDPLPDEVHACSPYLLRQLDLLQPRVILALGSFAARTLLGTEQSIGKLRGRVHFYHGIPLIATYHPAALLRNEAWKRPTWEDVQLARRVYDAAPGAATTTPS